MGISIWMYMEYRKRKTKKYKFGGRLDAERNYPVFGIIAGIGNLEIKPLYPPRGLPGGVNDCIYKEYKEVEGNTPSWLTTSELRECLDAVNEAIKKWDESVGITYEPDWAKSYEEIYDYMKSYEDVGEPARVVFWFD